MLWNSGTCINILHLHIAGKRKKRIFRDYSSNFSEKYLCEPLCELRVSIPLDLTFCCRPLGDSVAQKFSSVQSLSRVWLFAAPWTAACHAFLYISSPLSLLKFMSIRSVMPSNHLILCRPLLLLPSVFPSIRVFSNGSALLIRWPKCWSFSFSISPSNEYSGLIFFRMDWVALKSPIQKEMSLAFLLSDSLLALHWVKNKLIKTSVTGATD